MYYQFPQSSLSSIKPAYDGKQSITFSDNNQSNSQATEMNHQWQTAVLNILNEQRESLFDLLQLTLHTHLPIHSHHRVPMKQRQDMSFQRNASTTREYLLRLAPQTKQVQAATPCYASR